MDRKQGCLKIEEDRNKIENETVKWNLKT